MGYVSFREGNSLFAVQKLEVDDDQIYHPFLLQRLLAISADIPGAMIGGLSYHQEGIHCWKHNKRPTA